MPAYARSVRALRPALVVLALGALPAQPAAAVNVGYYDMTLGAGSASQVAPITAAGQTAIQIFDLSPAELAGIDVLMVQNPSNGSYGAEYLARLADIQTAVSNGLILVIHDRYVSNPDGTGGAKTILPGGSGFTISRDFADPNNIEIVSTSTSVTSGAGGVLTASSLDNGSFSSHGFAASASLPALARRILSRTNPAEVVAFLYPFGDGGVYYSTMPLDQFLAGGGANPPRDAFNLIYAPNVVDYAARLALGVPDLGVALDDQRTASVPGTDVAYSLTVMNFGIGAATGAVLTASLPPSLGSVTWTCVASGGSCTPSGSGSPSDVVDLSVGGTLTYTLRAHIAPTALGTLTLSATIQPATGMDPSPGNNTASDTNPLNPTADVAIDLVTVHALPPSAPFHAQITVRNAGPSTATGLVVTVPVPAGLAADLGAGAGCGGLTDCPVADLAPGATQSLDVFFDRPSPYLGPDPITTLGAVSTLASDPQAGNNAARSRLPLGGTPSADLAVSVSGPPSAALGSTVTYLVQVSNAGPHDARSLQLAHTPPPGLFFVAATAPCAAGSFPCSLGDLNPGGTRSLRVTFGIPGGYAGPNPIVYAASVSSSTATDPAAGNNSGSTGVPLGADTVDLRVQQSGPAQVGLASPLTYLISVENQGPATATGVTLSDPAPPGLAAGTGDPPCSLGFPCNLGTLAPGARRELRAFFVAPASGAPALLTSTTSVVATQPEGFAADNSASALTGLLTPAADVAVTKAAPAEIAAGEALPFTLLVSNRGPAAVPVTLDDLAPANLVFVAASSPCESGFPCLLGTLPVGFTRALSLVLGVEPDHVSPNPIVNQAMVLANVLDPTLGNDSSSTSTHVGYVADLGISKTNGRLEVSPGQALTYTLTVTSQGPSDLAGATVTDTLPPALTAATWACTASAGSSCAASGSGSIADTVNLRAGGTLTYVLQATVAPAASGTLTNTATVAPPAGASDPVAGNDSASDADPVVPPADLVTTKMGPASVVAGTQLAYTVRVTNQGAGTARGVSLADPTPPGITFLSASAPCMSGFPCSLPDLAPSGFVELVVTYAVPPGFGGATISNTATASTVTPDSNPANDTVTAVTPVSRQADLAVTKTDGRATVVPGQPVTYTITVSNLGPSHATGATVTDTPPAVLLSASWTCTPAGGASCTAAGSGAIAQTVNLPVGGSLTYLLTATVDPAASAAVVNQVSVAPSAGTTDPVAGNNLASDASGLAPLADLAVTKTDGRTSTVPGEAVSYTITVSNAGPSNVVGATISDTPPAALLAASWTCTPTGGASCPAASGSGAIAGAANLPAGSHLTFVLGGTVDPAATGTLANTASVMAPPAVTDPTSGNNSATDQDTLTRVAQLSLGKTGPGSVARGGALTFAFSVHNAGPSDAHVDLTDPTPPGLTLTSADAPCSGGFPCSLGTLAAGATVSFTATYAVPAAYAGPDPIVNQAAIASDAADPAPADDSARSATAVDRAATADLAISKTAPSVATLASTVTYTLTVSNLGPDDAADVHLSETIPAGLSFVSASPPCATSFDCSLGGLPVGASRTIEVVLAIPPDYAGPSLIVNTASVSAATADPATANNSASALTSLVAAAADLAVSKRGPAAATAGQSVSYDLTVTNRGPSPSTNTRLADPTPPGLSFAGATAPCAGGFPCFLDSLAPGASVNVRVTFNVPANYSGPNPITNTASAQANELDGLAGNDSATATTGVGAEAADLAVEKRGPATARAGEVLTYTLLVRNLGPGLATAVSLADPTPAGTSFVAATAPCASGFPCDLGSLAAGSSVVVQARFRAASALATGTSVVNQATVSSPSPDPQPGNNTVSTTTLLSVAADLAITKTDGLTTIAPGRPITYTVVASNLGPSDAPNALVEDTFPAALAGLPWTCTATGGASCGTSGGSGTISRLVQLTAGGSVTFTATGTVDPGASGLLTNTATITPPAGVPDPVAGNNSATDVDTLTPEADLTITKTDGSVTAVPGGTVAYTITVHNLGPSHAPGATVTDSFASILAGVSWTCTASAGSSCAASGTLQILDTVNLLAGGTLTYSATATVHPEVTGTLSNTASVISPAGVSDPATANNSATDLDTLTPMADLALAKDDGAATALPGSQTVYTLTVTNAGPSHAPGSLVSDSFPLAITAVSWTCSASGGASCGAASGSGNLSETVSLPAGGQVVFQATAGIDLLATGSLVNTASVAPGAGVTDPSPANNSDGDTDSLLLAADLVVSKTVDRSRYLAGDPVTYRVTASNGGPASLTGARVRDTLPAVLGSTTWTCTASAGASCAAAGAGNLDQLVDLPVGGAVVFELRGIVLAAASGPIVNTAEVSPPAGAGDPDPGDDVASATILPAEPLFADGFESGDTSGWTLTVP